MSLVLQSNEEKDCYMLSLISWICLRNICDHVTLSDLVTLSDHVTSKHPPSLATMQNAGTP